MTKNGYFNASDKMIEKYIRVEEEKLKIRRLTKEEIRYFKKDKFLEVGEVLPKVEFEELFLEKTNSNDYDDSYQSIYQSYCQQPYYQQPLPEIDEDEDEDEIPF
jgi:hypothetical protein